MNDRLRIGDADREDAARELGEHFALGRITVDEHAERLEQIWSARTAADLAPAFRDLPRPQSTRPRAGRPEPRGRSARSFELPRFPFPLKVLITIVALWWGFHHLLFLVLGVAAYVVFVRPFLHRRRWRGRGRGRWDHGPFPAGWH